MGWPVEWLQEMISAEAFDKWCLYHARYPLDDQSNFHMPLASLHASFLSSKSAERRSDSSKVFKISECMVFAERKDGEEGEFDENLIMSPRW